MKKPTDKAIIERLEKWFPAAQSHWKKHHDRFEARRSFAKASSEYGQWDKDEYFARESENPPRITLTENLLGPFGYQVVNDIRQNEYGAQLLPRDSGADPRLAKMRQGLHRGVQQIGEWKPAFGQAADDLVFGGLGAWRMITQRRDPATMRKEIQFLEVDPSRLFHGDGTHRKSNFSDVTDSLIYEPYSKTKFKEEFGRDPEEFLGKQGTNGCWGRADTPWVDDYFFIEKEPDTILMYQGKEYLASDPQIQAIAESMGMEPLDLADFDKDGNPLTESTTVNRVWNAKLVHREVLRVDAWPGYCIPNFLATGRKVYDREGLKYMSLLEPAEDVQRAHNFAFSALVERAGMAPKVRIFMPIEGMESRFMDIYNGISSWNGVVPYKQFADASGSERLDKPYQEPPIQTDPAFADLRAMTEQGIRNVLGMWETSLGAQSNEKSGIAIQTRERQADTGNFDWSEALALPAEHTFKAVDEILSKVYDVPTQIRIVGEDDKEEVIWAASLEANDPNPNGYFNLNQGKYDLLCKMAPSNDTKREEQMRGMEMLFQHNPQLAAGLAPAYIAIQDWKNAEKMAADARAIRASQFPGVKFSDDQEGQQQLPPQAAQQMQQMQAQLEQMGQQLQQVMPKMQQLQTENARLQIDNHAIKQDKALELERLKLDWFKAQNEAGDKASKTGLTADKQQHDKQIDKAELVLKAEGQAQKAKQDEKNFALTGAKAAGDHALKADAQAHGHALSDKDSERADRKQAHDEKVSQQGKANGGKPGNKVNGDR